MSDNFIIPSYFIERADGEGGTTMLSKDKARTIELKQAQQHVIEELDTLLFEAHHFFEPKELLYIDKQKYRTFRKKYGLREKMPPEGAEYR